MKSIIKNYWKLLPNFDWSHILLRIPLAVVFIQQGLSKFPVNYSMADGLGINHLTWLIVCYGEILAGVGLLVGAVATLYGFKDISAFAVIGDLLTRFSGIVMCCITTGVFWTVIKPQSLADVDMFHLFLWVGGLYFALRGNWAVAQEKKA